MKKVTYQNGERLVDVRLEEENDIKLVTGELPEEILNNHSICAYTAHRMNGKILSQYKRLPHPDDRLDTKPKYFAGEWTKTSEVAIAELNKNIKADNTVFNGHTTESIQAKRKKRLEDMTLEELQELLHEAENLEKEVED